MCSPSADIPLCCMFDHIVMYVMLFRAFQLLGLALGGGGGMERLHWLLERAFDEDINQLNQTFISVTATL